MNSADLWQLENNFWTGDAEYYRRHVSDAAVMVFPGMVLDKAASIANIGWRHAGPVSHSPIDSSCRCQTA